MPKIIQILNSLFVAGSTAISINQNTKLASSLNMLSNNQTLENQDLNLHQFSKNDEIAGHKATENEINKFSNLVPYYKFFIKLDDLNTIGYAEGPQHQGLCEYISLSTLFLYDELFVSSGYFTDEEFSTYFTNPDLKDSNKISIPQHKYHYFNKPENSLARKLWEKNNSATDIKTGVTLSRAFRRWTANKDIDSKIKDEYSASWMHSSNPENLLIKYNIPVLVSFTSTGGHNVLIYGYDSITESYLVHYGCQGFPAVIIKKSDIWSYFSMGFWNAFYHNPSTNVSSINKHFKYNDKMYTWKELQEKNLSFDDIKTTWNY